MQKQTNPLLCDPEIGICETPSVHTTLERKETSKAVDKPVKIIYYTDPICSSCWGIEPQLRKLKLEYGDNFEIAYRMGGLLKDWTYNGGGISKPTDVAHHWDEVSLHYDMPIDGDIWLENPLASSYPPSIAFKAAQMQNEEKAILFLRTIREMVFLQKKNITEWSHLESAATFVGLNIVQFKSDYEGYAKVLFNQDLQLASQLGVRGFPTMIFTDAKGNIETVYGSKPYHVFENALQKMNPSALKTNYDKDWLFLFSMYNSFTAKEFSELSGKTSNESQIFLDGLTANKELNKLATKNGAIWTKVKNSH